MKEGGAEDSAIREGGREGGISTHEESRGSGGGGLDRCRCVRPCLWERWRDTGNDKMGVVQTAEDAERWVHVCMVGSVPKMLERIIIIH